MSGQELFWKLIVWVQVGCAAVVRFAAWLWPYLTNFFGSEFFAALFGALAGAGVAYWSASSLERRKTLLEEISATNGAIQLSISILNSMIGLDRQNLRDMVAIYRRQFDRFVALNRLLEVRPIERLASPRRPIEFVFHNDFRELSIPLLPDTELRETLLQKIPRCTLAVAFVVPLQQSIKSLNEAAENRKRQIPAVQQIEGSERLPAFFGVKNSTDFTDEKFVDSLTGLMVHTEDAKYFAMRLAEVLIDHGKKVSVELGKRAPKITRIVKIDAASKLFLPDPANYPYFERIVSHAKIAPALETAETEELSTLA